MDGRGFRLLFVSGSGRWENPRVRRSQQAAPGPGGHLLQDGAADGEAGSGRFARRSQKGEWLPPAPPELT